MDSIEDSMKEFRKLILAIAGILCVLPVALSQELDLDAFKKTIIIENPVYFPVIGVGTGYFSYFGNVNDSYRSYTVGQPGLRINIAQYLSKIKSKQYMRVNAVFMMGSLYGTERNVSETSELKNLNFKSDIISIGVNMHYSFKPALKGEYFEPFISLGVEFLTFDTKGDYYFTKEQPYYYWTDGTIRTAPYNGDNPDEKILPRSYQYITDLRKANQSGLGEYGQMALSIPVDFGFDFNISRRVTLRVATSVHLAMTSLIDDKSSKSRNDDYKGTKIIDWFTFSYLSLHADIFSSGESKIIDDVFIDLDGMDLTLYDDEDNDGVPDIIDMCPNTPPGAVVDSVGCPIDTDGDGIPDFMDREINSRPGAIVDEYGVEISEESFLEKINSMEAIRRNEVESFLMMQKVQNKKPVRGLPIPAKFKSLDKNGDGYISFDELMKAMNDFFDDNSSFSPSDIEELRNFFFEQ